MSQIGEIKKLSDTRFLNFYEFEAVHRDGTSAPYFVASRAKKIEQLKAVSHENKPDGVILFGVYGEKKDRVVLVRQYRYPLGDYVYEFPAGLVESGEDMVAAGIIDPAKVTRSALENAASVSAMVLTTESLVADKPDPQADAAMAAAAAQGGGMGGMY